MLLFQLYIVYNWLRKIQAQLKEVTDRKLRISSKTNTQKKGLFSLYFIQFLSGFSFFYHNMQKNNLLKVNYK